MNNQTTQRRRRSPIQHYLLSLHIAPDIRMHGYLLTDDRRQAPVAAQRMVTEAEKVSSYPLLSMVLVTRLAADIELVREIAGRCSEEVKRLLASATDFHFSAWAMHDGDPDDARLMALH